MLFFLFHEEIIYFDLFQLRITLYGIFHNKLNKKCNNVK